MKWLLAVFAVLAVGVVGGAWWLLYTEPGLHWRKEWVLVMDGGDCFFQLQFDVESGTFTALMVNGEA